MKIAIRGHESRGKEIIQILESLGGINDGLHEGNNSDCYYELHGNIIWCVSTKGINFKYYTLEEFEKDFPFKIGEKIKYITSIAIIKEYCYINNEPAYKVESMELGIVVTILAKLLEPYKEMEIRNITLTLDKAKEWYNKGGELREIALQAYSEEELTKVELPKTWEEFCKNYPVKREECWIGAQDEIVKCTFSYIDIDRKYKNWIPSKKSAEAHLAMIQLEQLRDCWRQGWKPTSEKAVYAIKVCSGKLNVVHYLTREFLSFPTKEMAEEFLKCFRDLIEKAGDLI